MPLQKERMDCFVASLLAMTACFESHDGVMVSFTAATNWLSVNGFGRNANCWFSGRLFSKASSAYPQPKMILRAGLRPRISLSKVGPSIFGIITYETTRQTHPFL